MSDLAWAIEQAMTLAWHRLPATYNAPALPTSLILRDLSYAAERATREHLKESR